MTLIASADHGQAHHSQGPYGFSPAAQYDETICNILEHGTLSELRQLPPALVAETLADS